MPPALPSWSKLPGRVAVASAAVLAVGLAGGCSGLLGLDEFGAGSSEGGGGSAATNTGATTGPGSTSGGGDATTGSTTSNTTTTTSGGGEGGVGSSTASGDGGSDGGGGDGGGGSPPVCDPVASACVPAAPVGWVGPIAVHERPSGEEAPGCLGSPYPAEYGAFNGDLDPGAATCGCACGPATNITCTGAARVCYRSSSVQCSLACLTPDVTVPQNTCLNGSVSAAYAAVIPPAPVAMGSCTSMANVNIPEPVWAREVKACAGAETTPLGCDAGEVCAPRPLDPFQGLCISREGDLECPAGWDQKRIYHDGFSDERECSACSCGAASSTCGGRVDFNYNACSFNADSVPAGQCQTVDGANMVENLSYAPQPSGTCPPVGGDLSGEVVPEGTTTFCCIN